MAAPRMAALRMAELLFYGLPRSFALAVMFVLEAINGSKTMYIKLPSSALLQVCALIWSGAHSVCQCNRINT